MKTKRRLRHGIAGIAAALFASVASAQAYPNKPVRIIMPYAAGGTGDLMARLVAQELTKQSGQPFVVENRTGAGGLIGYGVAARASADGYTLVAMDMSYTMFPALYGSRAEWNLENDLVPVSMYARAPFVMAVAATKPYRSVGELIQGAKDKPGEITFGTPGTGTLHHVFTAQLEKTVGASMMHVPYRGASEAMAAVLGGNVDWTFVAMPTIVSQLDNDRLRPIAVTSDARMAQAPELPTLRESGVPLTVANWFGLAAPRGTPPEALAYLETQVALAVRAPQVQEKLRVMGAEPVGNTTREFQQIFRDNMTLWSGVIRQADIRLE